MIFLEPIKSAAIGFSKKIWQLFSSANNEISSCVSGYVDIQTALGLGTGIAGIFGALR